MASYHRGHLLPVNFFMCDSEGSDDESPAPQLYSGGGAPPDVRTGWLWETTEFPRPTAAATDDEKPHRSILNPEAPEFRPSNIGSFTPEMDVYAHIPMSLATRGDEERFLEPEVEPAFVGIVYFKPPVGEILADDEKDYTAGEVYASAMDMAVPELEFDLTLLGEMPNAPAGPPTEDIYKNVNLEDGTVGGPIVNMPDNIRHDNPQLDEGPIAVTDDHHFLWHEEMDSNDTVQNTIINGVAIDTAQIDKVLEMSNKLLSALRAQPSAKPEKKKRKSKPRNKFVEDPVVLDTEISSNVDALSGAVQIEEDGSPHVQIEPMLKPKKKKAPKKKPEKAVIVDDVLASENTPMGKSSPRYHANLDVEEENTIVLPKPGRPKLRKIREAEARQAGGNPLGTEAIDASVVPCKTKPPRIHDFASTAPTIAEDTVPLGVQNHDDTCSVSVSFNRGRGKYIRGSRMRGRKITPNGLRPSSTSTAGTTEEQAQVPDYPVPASPINDVVHPPLPAFDESVFGPPGLTPGAPIVHDPKAVEAVIAEYIPVRNPVSKSAESGKLEENTFGSQSDINHGLASVAAGTIQDDTQKVAAVTVKEDVLPVGAVIVKPDRVHEALNVKEHLAKDTVIKDSVVPVRNVTINVDVVKATAVTGNEDMAPVPGFTVKQNPRLVAAANVDEEKPVLKTDNANVADMASELMPKIKNSRVRDNKPTSAQAKVSGHDFKEPTDNVDDDVFTKNRPTFVAVEHLPGCAATSTDDPAPQKAAKQNRKNSAPSKPSWSQVAVRYPCATPKPIQVSQDSSAWPELGEVSGKSKPQSKQTGTASPYARPGWIPKAPRNAGSVQSRRSSSVHSDISVGTNGSVRTGVPPPLDDMTPFRDSLSSLAVHTQEAKVAPTNLHHQERFPLNRFHIGNGENIHPVNQEFNGRGRRGRGGFCRGYIDRFGPTDGINPHSRFTAKEGFVKPPPGFESAPRHVSASLAERKASLKKAITPTLSTVSDLDGDKVNVDPEAFKKNETPEPVTHTTKKAKKSATRDSDKHNPRIDKIKTTSKADELNRKVAAEHDDSSPVVVNPSVEAENDDTENISPDDGSHADNSVTVKPSRKTFIEAEAVVTRKKKAYKLRPTILKPKFVPKPVPKPTQKPKQKPEVAPAMTEDKPTVSYPNVSGIVEDLFVPRKPHPQVWSSLAEILRMIDGPQYENHFASHRRQSSPEPIIGQIVKLMDKKNDIYDDDEHASSSSRTASPDPVGRIVELMDDEDDILQDLSEEFQDAEFLSDYDDTPYEMDVSNRFNRIVSSDDAEPARSISPPSPTQKSAQQPSRWADYSTESEASPQGTPERKTALSHVGPSYSSSDSSPDHQLKCRRRRTPSPPGPPSWPLHYSSIFSWKDETDGDLKVDDPLPALQQLLDTYPFYAPVTYKHRPNHWNLLHPIIVNIVDTRRVVQLLGAHSTGLRKYIYKFQLENMEYLKDLTGFSEEQHHRRLENFRINLMRNIQGPKTYMSFWKDNLEKRVQLVENCRNRIEGWEGRNWVAEWRMTARRWVEDLISEAIRAENVLAFPNEMELQALVRSNMETEKMEKMMMEGGYHV